MIIAVVWIYVHKTQTVSAIAEKWIGTFNDDCKIVGTSFSRNIAVGIVKTIFNLREKLGFVIVVGNQLREIDSQLDVIVMLELQL